MTETLAIAALVSVAVLALLLYTFPAKNYFDKSGNYVYTRGTASRFAVGTTADSRVALENPGLNSMSANYTMPLPVLLAQIPIKTTAVAYSRLAGNGSFILGDDADAAAATKATVAIPDDYDIKVEVDYTLTTSASTTAGTISLIAYDADDAAVQSILLHTLDSTAYTNLRKQVTTYIPSALAETISYFKVVLASYGGSGNVDFVTNATTGGASIIRIEASKVTGALTATYA